MPITAQASSLGKAKAPGLEVRWLISVNVNADDLNLPAEIARRLKGKRVAISEIGDGFLRDTP